MTHVHDDAPLTGDALPHMRTAAPGPASIASVDLLARAECPAITARRARRAQESGVDQDPIVWHRALGANVEDLDRNLYVDLTSAFAVTGLGHNPPAVVAAGHAQLDRLIHAMGDVYPGAPKVALSERLARVTPDGLTQSILGLSGASAIEAALKTAVMHTGRPGVFAFTGSYHGLSHGALAASAYRAEFRRPFLPQLNPHVTHVPYPNPHHPPFGLAPGEASDETLVRMCLGHIRGLLEDAASGHEAPGCILLEPVQGRGGYVVPPPGFLQGLRDLCDAHGIVLAFDEIYTGFGRTGRMFACEHEGVRPDLLCVGKAMGGGFPISAVVGTPEVMGSWGSSRGEAIHTSTFLGNPLGCAMAVAAIDALVDEGWPARVGARAASLSARIDDLRTKHPERLGARRGLGFMQGVEIVDPVTRAPDTGTSLGLVAKLRTQGFLVLPTGPFGHVLAITPPFVITDAQLDAFFDALDGLLVG